jgi:membrane fusion protein, adhesin transport system
MQTAFSRTTRMLEADRAGLSRWMMGLGLLLLVAWSAWFALGRVTIYAVSRSARLEVATSARTIAGTSGGRLIALNVHPGQRVHAGDRIAELDAAPLRLRLAEASARLSAYPVRIAALERELGATKQADDAGGRAARASVAAAQARLRSSKEEARFQQELAGRQAGDAADGGLALVEAERAASKARQTSAESSAAGSEADHAREDGAFRSAERAETAAALAAQLADLRASASSTRAEVDGLRLALGRQVVRAPLDGTIGDVTALHVGELIGPGERLATLVPAGDLHIVAAFDPAAAFGRLATGQSARMRVDGRDWTEFGELAAEVASVGAEPGEETLRVELRLAAGKDPRRFARHGMSGVVQVAVESISPATLVLRSVGRAFS